MDDVSLLFKNTSELSAFFNSGSVPGDKKLDGFHRFFYVSRRFDEPLDLYPYDLTKRLLSNYQISNPYFVSLTTQEFARRELREQQDFLRIVSPFPAISGPVLESFAVNWLANSSARSLKCTLLDDRKIEIPLNLKRRDLSNLTAETIEDNVVYIPPERNFPTLDAVAVSQKRVITLQMTLTKSSHEFKGGGIGRVWTLFGDQATSYEWYFIFCVRTKEDGMRLANSARSTVSLRIPAPAGGRSTAERRIQQRMGLRVGYAVLEDITSFKVNASALR